MDGGVEGGCRSTRPREGRVKMNSPIASRGDKMKRRMILSALALAMVVGTISMVAVAAQNQTGNGAPSGSHFTLNIIGVAKNKSVNMDQAAGNVIFVPLYGTAKIALFGPADYFAVLDKNGTDGPAAFQLPDPGLG